MSRTYADLIAEFPLRPLRSVRQAERAGRIAFQLASRGRLTRNEQDYLDVLTALIEQFEAERYPMPVRHSPRELLQFLRQENGLNLSQLAAETGIQVSTLSEILHGRREFTLAHVRKLSARFRCDPGLWIGELRVAGARA